MSLKKKVLSLGGTDRVSVLQRATNSLGYPGWVDYRFKFRGLLTEYEVINFLYPLNIIKLYPGCLSQYENVDIILIFGGDLDNPSEEFMKHISQRIPNASKH